MMYTANITREEFVQSLQDQGKSYFFLTADPEAVIHVYDSARTMRATLLVGVAVHARNDYTIYCGTNL